MTRMNVAAVVGLIALGAINAACGNGSRQPDAGLGAAQAPGGSGSAQDLKIAFSSTPAPPRTGENTFEVTVVDQNGQPVTDANVSVEFYMPAMPSMNMPEMRNRVDLAHDGGGRYRGQGTVMMAGGWDVTVRVSRGGREIDSEKLSVTAQ